MSKLRNKMNKAQETRKAVVKIGFIGQVVIDVGVTSMLFSEWAKMPECFFAYTDEPESETRERSIAKAKQVSSQDNPQVFPAIYIKEVPDTAISNTKLGDKFLQVGADRFGVDSAAFTEAYMSPEIEDNVGKKIWVHVAWRRITSEFGGDLSLKGDDARSQMGLVVTHLENKKAATTLAEQLRNGDLKQSDLTKALGFPEDEVNATLYGDKSSSDDDVVLLTAISDTAKASYTMNDILSPQTLDFFKTEYKNAGNDPVQSAAGCGLEPGEVALIVGDDGYFKALMTDNGDDLQKVAEASGVVNASDIANLLGIEVNEPAF